MAWIPLGICSFLYWKPLALTCVCWDCWGSMALSIAQGEVCGVQEERGMLLGQRQHGEGIGQYPRAEQKDTGPRGDQAEERSRAWEGLGFLCDAPEIPEGCSQWEGFYKCSRDLNLTFWGENTGLEMLGGSVCSETWSLHPVATCFNLLSQPLCLIRGDGGVLCHVPWPLEMDEEPFPIWQRALLVRGILRWVLGRRLLGRDGFTKHLGSQGLCVWGAHQSSSLLGHGMVLWWVKVRLDDL